MIDIETRVAESMRTRAAAAPPTGNMHERVLGHAIRLRRRRTLLAASASVFATAAVVGVVAVVPAASLLDQDRPSPADRPASASTVPAPPPTRSPGATTLPELVDVPAAATLPAAVGTDPLVLHFDVYLGALNMTASTWRSGAGFESVGSEFGPKGEFVEALIGTDPAVLDARRIPLATTYYIADGRRVPASREIPAGTVSVAGRPATLYSVVDDPTVSRPAGTDVARATTAADLPAFVLRWEPVAGLHALVQSRGYGRSLVEKVAGVMRFDHAQRCVTPLRFTPPAGGVLTECATGVRATPEGTGGVWLNSSFAYTMPAGTRASVAAERKPQRAAHDLAQFTATHTVNGAKAQWRTADPAGLWLLEYGPAPAEVFVAGLGESESVELVRGMTFGPDLTTVTGWPAGPTG